jgi:hypothetical protein
MFNRKVVQKALRKTWHFEVIPGNTSDKPAGDQSSVTSRLIYDIFGGEIRKTPEKKGFHFYNRIDGEHIDLALSEIGKSSPENSWKDLPSTPEETYNYFAPEDYSTFYLRFIQEFEDLVGLDKYRHGVAV